MSILIASYGFYIKITGTHGYSSLQRIFFGLWNVPMEFNPSAAVSYPLVIYHSLLLKPWPSRNS